MAGVSGLLVIGLLLIPPLYGVVLLPEMGGWCHISGYYGPNYNVSYSVLFQGINFTFLYDSYDFVLTCNPRTAHFRVQFQDDTVEYLNLYYGGFGGITSPLITYSINDTVHVGPQAGILIEDSAPGWQYVVST